MEASVLFTFQRAKAFQAAIAMGGAGLALCLLKRRCSRYLCDASTPVTLCPDYPAHRRWIRQMRAFIFDIDGVIYNESGPIAGAGETLQALRAAGKTVIFMSNNAARSPADVVRNFVKYGASANSDEIITSAMVAADYLQRKGLRGSQVYVVGMDALAQELRLRAGVAPFGMEDDAKKTRNDCITDFLPAMEPPPNSVAAVVVGQDFGLNYYKVARACNYLKQNPECLFVATNPDPFISLSTHTVLPTAGSIVQSIATAAGRQPDIVCGKPSKLVAEQLIKERGLDPATTCMVGDRTDTDIEFGRNGGMATLFVESGGMTKADAMSADLSRRPQYISPSIAVLRELL